MVVFRCLLMPSPSRPAGLIQRYREELQARHYARRTVELHVSASTQNQALSALLFYTESCWSVIWIWRV